ncbi:MAG: hypothetical protein Q7S96_03135 [bacterium]|nr:hypothetical protein [bacterium]
MSDEVIRVTLLPDGTTRVDINMPDGSTECDDAAALLRAILEIGGVRLTDERVEDPPAVPNGVRHGVKIGGGT